MDGIWYATTPSHHDNQRLLISLSQKECTEIAVKRRIQRLKEQVSKNSSGAPGDGDGTTSSVPTTPEKRKRGGKGTPKAKNGESKKSPTKKAKVSEEGVDESSDVAEGL